MSIDSMRKKLGANAWPVLLPLGKEDQFKGQIDVINKKAVIYSDSDQLGSTYELADVPKEYVDLVDKAYHDLVEQISNLDDEVAGAVLEEKPVTPEMLKAGIRRQTIANKFVPVAGGSALKNKGVQYWSMLWSITCRVRSTFPGQGHGPRLARADGGADG